MKKRGQIDKEVAALKALKPIGPRKARTAATIAAALQEFEEEFDRTAEEWNELTARERDIRDLVQSWKAGDETAGPSQGWGGLVEPA